MLITTVCDSEDDKMLIEAMKSMPWSTVDIELECEIGTKVTVTNKDFNRFIDLAEYGLKMKNVIKETKEKQEASIVWGSNSTMFADCDRCLCQFCKYGVCGCNNEDCLNKNCESGEYVSECQEYESLMDTVKVEGRKISNG